MEQARASETALLRQELQRVEGSLAGREAGLMARVAALVEGKAAEVAGALEARSAEMNDSRWGAVYLSVDDLAVVGK